MKVSGGGSSSSTAAPPNVAASGTEALVKSLQENVAELDTRIVETLQIAQQSVQETKSLQTRFQRIDSGSNSSRKEDGPSTDAFLERLASLEKLQSTLMPALDDIATKVGQLDESGKSQVMNLQKEIDELRKTQKSNGSFAPQVSTTSGVSQSDQLAAAEEAIMEQVKSSLSKFEKRQDEFNEALAQAQLRTAEPSQVNTADDALQTLRDELVQMLEQAEQRAAGCSHSDLAAFKTEILSMVGNHKDAPENSNIATTSDVAALKAEVSKMLEETRCAISSSTHENSNIATTTDVAALKAEVMKMLEESRCVIPSSTGSSETEQKLDGLGHSDFAAFKSEIVSLVDKRSGMQQQMVATLKAELIAMLDQSKSPTQMSKGVDQMSDVLAYSDFAAFKTEILSMVEKHAGSSAADIAAVKADFDKAQQQIRSQITNGPEVLSYSDFAAFKTEILSLVDKRAGTQEVSALRAELQHLSGKGSANSTDLADLKADLNVVKKIAEQSKTDRDFEALRAEVFCQIDKSGNDPNSAPAALTTELDAVSKQWLERLQVTKNELRQELQDVQTKSSTEVTSMVSRLETLITRLGSTLERSEDSTKEALSALADSTEEKRCRLQASLSELSNSTEEKVTTLKSKLEELSVSLKNHEDKLENRYKEATDALDTRVRPLVEDVMKDMKTGLYGRFTEELAVVKSELEEASKDLVTSLEARSLDTMEALGARVEQRTKELVTSMELRCKESISFAEKRIEDSSGEAFKSLKISLEHRSCEELAAVEDRIEERSRAALHALGKGVEDRSVGQLKSLQNLLESRCQELTHSLELRLETTSGTLRNALQEQKEQSEKALLETTKIVANAESLASDLRLAVCELKTTKAATTDQMQKLEESSAERLLRVEEKLQSECSNLRTRHGDLKAQYSHLKSQLEEVSNQVGEGLERKLDELDRKAIVAVDGLEKRRLGAEENQNEKIKGLEAKVLGVMNSADLGTVAERLRGVTLRVEQAERVAGESQKQVDDVRLRVDRLRRGLPGEAGSSRPGTATTTTTTATATPAASSSTSGAIERCEHLGREIESMWRRISRLEGRGDGPVSAEAARECNATVEAMRSELGGQLKQITRKCAALEKALEELRRQMHSKDAATTAARSSEVKDLQQQLQRHGGNLQRLDEAMQHTRLYERSNEERRMEIKAAVEKLQHRFDSHEKNFVTVESRGSAEAGRMTQAQELHIASLVEQAIGGNLRNSVDYAVRRTESLGDRIRALEDSMNDLGDNARVSRSSQSKASWSEGRWASEASRRSEAEHDAAGNAVRAPSTPRNVAPPSTSRDRPVSAGAHRRLRSASPAASDGADRRPEVGEAWGVDPPRIPRRITPPPA
jgi:DNA repair exonuclease SbcCD ATPase subunit